jgi:peptidoglycan/xylan/chitin deacetylase (PgdA/CDA1 family)/glycosyltransferase involved in cell wall biosynthesis
MRIPVADETSRSDAELSIVIPTHGRPGRLKTCIGSVAEQSDLPAGVELIVVVDGGDPATEAMLDSLALPFPLRTVVQERARQAVARNRGAREARGRFVLFLDDDVVAEPGLVAAHMSALRSDEGIVALGRIEKVLPPRASRWARVRQAAWRSHYDRLAAGREPRFTDCYGGNLSLSREAFVAVGGFAPDLTPEEDVELGYRLVEAGLRLVFLANAVVREDDRDTLRRYVRLACRRGQVGVTIFRRTPALLPHLRLGGAFELSRRWVMLRHLLMALRVPPLLLALVGRLAPTDAIAGRWFGFLFGYGYWWGVRRSVDRHTWRSLQRGTAILMYHAVGHDGEAPSRYVVPHRRFRRQLAWLKRRGYNVVGLDDFVRARLEHRLLPPKSVVLTFDDGYADAIDLALPALERHGFPATVFLVSAANGQARWEDAGATANRPLLSLADARGLNGSRLTFGAHSRTHPRLSRLDSSELEREVAGSRSELEAALGSPVTTFAYPYGDSSPKVAEAVARAGFLAACAITPGRNRPACDLLSLNRLEVRGNDSLLRFALTVALGETRSSARRRSRD